MKIDFSKLVSSNGNFKTRSLFYEFRNETKSEYYPLTLSERPKEGLVSAYSVYMSADSEYDAAIKLVGSWKHWKVLSEAPFFKKELELWREEREIREATIGVTTLVNQAKEGNVSAAKYLVDKNTSKKVGRPTRTEIIEEKKKQARVDSKVSSIIDRMSKYQK